MKVRPATQADEAAVRELWGEFEREVPEPPGFEDPAEDPAELVYVAEADDGAVVGVLEASRPTATRWHVDLVHVRPAARRRGVATALLRELVREARGRGAERVSLDVLAANTAARSVWQRLGFEEVELTLAQPLETLERRVAEVPAGDSRASTHVQTDDRASVERALGQFVPRLAAPQVTAEGDWIRIADALLDADRDAQSRFASDLSDRLGAVVVALALERGAVVRFRLYERGRMVDEYLSVPGFYGELPKGDELALASNPTLVARLTGADRDEVRRVARTAASPAELPPAPELYERIARMMRLEP